MLCKAFKFGRISSTQFEKKLIELNELIKTVDLIGLPQVTACDEDGPVMFVFYTEKNKTVAQIPETNFSPKSKKD